jgi:hypothetical protein
VLVPGLAEDRGGVLVSGDRLIEPPHLAGRLARQGLGRLV